MFLNVVGILSAQHTRMHCPHSALSLPPCLFLSNTSFLNSWSLLPVGFYFLFVFLSSALKAIFIVPHLVPESFKNKKKSSFDRWSEKTTIFHFTVLCLYSFAAHFQCVIQTHILKSGRFSCAEPPLPIWSYFYCIE